jgi:hypothetical protein
MNHCTATAFSMGAAGTVCRTEESFRKGHGVRQSNRAAGGRLSDEAAQALSVPRDQRRIKVG